MSKNKWIGRKFEWVVNNFTRENVEKRQIIGDEWMEYNVMEQRIVKSAEIVGLGTENTNNGFTLEFYNEDLMIDAPDEIKYFTMLKIAILTIDNELDYCFSEGPECTEVMMIDDIFDNSSKYIVEDTLRLVIHIEECPCEKYKNDDHECNCGGEMPATLSDSCGKFFNSENFSDVKIICNDGVQFPAHQNVLASRSPVFNAMLTHDTLEKRTQRIKIDDIDGETMLEVLRFIYTDKVQNLDQLVSTVIYAAEKYDLPKLKKICAWKLFQCVPADRALQYLRIADCLNDKILLEESLSCINENVVELEGTDEWKAVDCALMAKITAYMEKKAAEVIKFTNSLYMDPNENDELAETGESECRCFYCAKQEKRPNP